MYAYQSILKRLEEEVRTAYARQVRDGGRSDYGAVVSLRYGHATADNSGTSGFLANACYAFLADGSALEGDADLFERIRLALAFQRRWQRSNRQSG